MTNLKTHLIPEVRGLLEKSVAHVFITMFGLEAETTPVDQLQLSGEPLVAGSVGFIGDASGVVYIHVTASFARVLTSRILGMPEAEIEGDEMVNDMVGELSNMVVGTVKSQLCDAGSPCVLTIPSIVRGRDFVIAPVSSSEQSQIGFRCGENHFLIHLQMKSEH